MSFEPRTSWLEVKRSADILVRQSQTEIGNYEGVMWKKITNTASCFHTNSSYDAVWNVMRRQGDKRIGTFSKIVSMKDGGSNVVEWMETLKQKCEKIANTARCFRFGLKLNVKHSRWGSLSAQASIIDISTSLMFASIVRFLQIRNWRTRPPPTSTDIWNRVYGRRGEPEYVFCIIYAHFFHILKRELVRCIGLWQVVDTRASVWLTSRPSLPQTAYANRQYNYQPGWLVVWLSGRKLAGCIADYVSVCFSVCLPVCLSS